MNEHQHNKPVTGERYRHEHEWGERPHWHGGPIEEEIFCAWDTWTSIHYPEGDPRAPERALIERLVSVINDWEGALFRRGIPFAPIDSDKEARADAEAYLR